MFLIHESNFFSKMEWFPSFVCFNYVIRSVFNKPATSETYASLHGRPEYKVYQSSKLLKVLLARKGYKTHIEIHTALSIKDPAFTIFAVA